MENIENIILYIVLGIIALVVLIFIVVFIVKLVKMTPDERKETLVTYLKGFVAKAESAIGSGHGDEKLAAVEEYFYKKAPLIMKMALSILGKDTLKELIELALEELKETFDSAVTTEKVEEEVIEEEVVELEKAETAE